MRNKLVWLAHVERTVVILAAFLAAFPLFQWWQEREGRAIDRLASLMSMVTFCGRLDEPAAAFSGLGEIDVYEHLCSAVTDHLNEWEDDHF